MDLAALLRRERAVTVAALAVLAAFAWGWLLTGAGMQHTMPEAEMPMDTGMDMAATMPADDMPSPPFLLVFAMWWTMMVAMMIPAAAPTILLHARAARHSRPDEPPATAPFLLGYLLAWGVFSLLAALLHLLLERAALLDPMAMGIEHRWLAGMVLVLAGLYQLSPAKNACLHQCRDPARFLATHYRPGPVGALRMGLLHGSWCVGCCWLLMALLFVGGVMNLGWIAVLTLLVAAEKLLPHGRQVASAAGAGCLAWGAWLLLG